MREFLTGFIAQFGIPALYTALVAYLLGSLNFAIIITKYFQNEDIRQHGSGNAGFTNVLRSVGKLPAILTFAGDFIKVIAAAIVGRSIFYLFATDTDFMFFAVYISGLFCLLGHIFPVYFNFKGGKGVVTATGMMLICNWKVVVIAGIVFAVVFFASRIISLSSISAVAVAPFITFIITFLDYRINLEKNDINFYANCIFPVTIVFITCALIIFMHRDNIKRLIKGQEKKITPKK